MLGLVEGHSPQIHKNIPSGNTKLKVVKHLIEPRFWSCRRDFEQSSIMCPRGTVLEYWLLKPMEHAGKTDDTTASDYKIQVIFI